MLSYAVQFKLLDYSKTDLFLSLIRNLSMCYYCWCWISYILADEYWHQHHYIMLTLYMNDLTFTTKEKNLYFLELNIFFYQSERMEFSSV